MTVHLADFNRIELYEAGAMLVTLLAFPGKSADDEEERSRVHASLCWCMLRATYEVYPDRAISPQSVKPIYSFQTQRDCNRN